MRRSIRALNQAGVERSRNATVHVVRSAAMIWKFVICPVQGTAGSLSGCWGEATQRPPGLSRSQRRAPITIPAAPPSIT